MHQRTGEAQWVNLDFIESVQVNEGELRLFANGEPFDVDGDLGYYLVEEEYVWDVCVSLDIPAYDVEILIKEQNKEKEDGKDLSFGNN
jgi:hypothetical protein